MESGKRRENKEATVRKDVKSFLRSLAVLILAVMVVFGTTFAWIEGGKNASTMGENCTVEAGAGLQFIGINDIDIKNGIITLPTSGNLEDCSSVDGRNIFIPTTGSIQATTPGTVEATTNLKFRSAVESDKNTKYITKDFIIKSMQSNTTPGDTPIYIGSKSTFSCTGSAQGRQNAFRVSLNFNDGSDPVVICPGLKFVNESEKNDAVSQISPAGDATLKSVTADPMAKYYYGTTNATPVFRLPNGESRRVTVTLWLEGTDANSTLDKVAGQDINMDLVLSTEDKNMRTITFVDYSPTSWVKNDNAKMYVVERGSSASYIMTQSDDLITYTASVPDSFTDIYFQRTTASTFNPNISDTQNTWSTTKGDDDLSASTTYYGIGRGESIDKANYGYWVNGTTTKMVDLYLTDVGNVLSIPDVQDSNGNVTSGHAPFVYVLNTDYGTDGVLKSWGGFEMQSVGKNDRDQSVYHMIIPADLDAEFTFNNTCGCGSHDDVTKKQTGDSSNNIKLSSYISADTPNMAKIGIYTKVDNGKITGWDYWDPKDVTFTQ